MVEARKKSSASPKGKRGGAGGDRDGKKQEDKKIEIIEKRQLKEIAKDAIKQVNKAKSNERKDAELSKEQRLN